METIISPFGTDRIIERVKKLLHTCTLSGSVVNGCDTENLPNPKSNEYVLESTTDMYLKVQQICT